MRAAMSASSAVPSLIARSKMVGLEVSPVTEYSAM